MNVFFKQFIKHLVGTRENSKSNHKHRRPRQTRSLTHLKGQSETKNTNLTTTKHQNETKNY